MSLKINISANCETLAKDMAKRFKKEIGRFIRQDKIHVCIPGGSTPKLFFRQLAKFYNKEIPWEKIHFYWGDERCVPNNHKESNYNMAKKNLLWFIDIPTENIHRVIGENKPALEWKRYASELSKNVPIINGFPRFDIIILGMGEDGHTASIFPKDLNLFESDEYCAIVRHPQTGQQRVTLTGKVLNNAKAVFFLAAGSKKQQIIKSIVNNNGAEYPSAHVVPFNGTLEFYLDKAAAGKN